MQKSSTPVPMMNRDTHLEEIDGDHPRLQAPSDVKPERSQDWHDGQDFYEALPILSRKTLHKTSKEIENFIAECQRDKENEPFPFTAFLNQNPTLTTPEPGWDHDTPPELDNLRRLERIIEPGHSEGVTLVVVPTGNQKKISVAKKFVSKMEDVAASGEATGLDSVRFIGREGKSEAGEQPYSHYRGLAGASNRIKNAHQQVLKEYREYSTDPQEHSEFHNVSQIKFVSFENHIHVNETSGLATDHPALVLYDDSRQDYCFSVGHGVVVSPYHLEFARACHYEEAQDGQEDKTKGLLTVGKAISLLSNGVSSSDDWHSEVCQKSRYDIILDDLMELWSKHPEIMQ